MRPIKFRAWQDKQPHQSAARGYVYSDDCYGLSTFFRCYNDEIIEQYTGLLDSKGVEVYEGDVVSDGADKGHIFWRVDLARFACTNSVMFDDRVEVIGTIHDAEYKELAK